MNNKQAPVQLSPETHKKIKVFCANKGYAMNAWVEEISLKAIKEDKCKDK